MSGNDDIDTAALRELALDLRWTWDHSTDELWTELDTELWSLTHNPWVVLQAATQKTLSDFLARPGFLRRVEDLLSRRRQYMESVAWFQQTHQQSPLTRVAYFSMEFALSEALPIYSGGLGNVAGDQLKAASDLGVPVIGVGLLYQQGYFRQVIGADGRQEALYPYNDPHQLPITPVRNEKGELLRLAVHTPGHKIWLRAWEVRVGAVTLYLLDSNDARTRPPSGASRASCTAGESSFGCGRRCCWGSGGWRLL